MAKKKKAAANKNEPPKDDKQDDKNQPPNSGDGDGEQDDKNQPPNSGGGDGKQDTPPKLDPEQQAKLVERAKADLTSALGNLVGAYLDYREAQDGPLPDDRGYVVNGRAGRFTIDPGLAEGLEHACETISPNGPIIANVISDLACQAARQSRK